MTSAPLLSAQDVATRMSLSVRQVRGLISKRLIRHVNVGGRYLIPENAIGEFLQLNMVEPKANGAISNCKE